MRPLPAGKLHTVRASGRQLRITCSSKRGGISANGRGGSLAGGPVTAWAAGAAATGLGPMAVVRFVIVPCTGGSEIGAMAVAGLAAGFGAAAGAAAGVGKDVFGSAAGAAAAGDSGFAEITLTPLRQAPESLASLRCRHCRASLPPGVTPEQFEMKSERQAERMALRCASVGCASAVPAKIVITDTAAARSTRVT